MSQIAAPGGKAAVGCVGVLIPRLLDVWAGHPGRAPECTACGGGNCMPRHGCPDRPSRRMRPWLAPYAVRRETGARRHPRGAQSRRYSRLVHSERVVAQEPFGSKLRVMGTRQPNRRLEDVGSLRVMAHPLRVRLYYALQALEAATASRLGESVNESPGLVSYHLRQLRNHGFVEEAPDLITDRRERWWRASSDGFRFSLPDDAAVPEWRAVTVALQRTALANQLERLESWRDEQPAWGSEWSEAAISSDSLLRLTPHELREMNEELQGVVRSWRKLGRGRSPLPATGGEATPVNDEEHSHDGREHIFLILHAFPFRP